MTGLAGRKALLTGATGFVGSHLARALLARGWQAAAIVRPTSDCSRLPDGVQPLMHDGTGGGLVNLVRQAAPDVVFHLAARFVAEHTAEDVGPLVADNILFPTQVLEATVRSGVCCFVNTGTAWQHFEGRARSPANLYAATKQAFADIIAYYVESVGLRCITLELGDTYGPLDRRPKLFRMLEEAARAGKVVEMSPGDQRLDLVHVEDVVRAYLQAAERVLRPDFAGSECWSVSSGAALPLREVVELYRRLNGGRPQVVWGARPYRAREVMIPWCGNVLPGWHPLTDLQDGLRQLVQGGE